MAIVTIEEVEKTLNKELTEVQRVRLENDLAAIQEELENWAHQKFEPTTIVNERHYVSDGTRIFLHWGEPDGEVLLRYGSTTAQPTPYLYNPFTGVTNYGYRGRVYVTYSVDTSVVDHYQNTIRQVIMRAATASLMRPDIVRFRVTNSYSVEGLSIQYDDGASSQTSINTGQLPDVSQIDLVGLLGLKRTVMV